MLDSYEIRDGSGGGGRWHGGNGGVRRVRFLEPMTASILSNGRLNPAFGMAGGQPGQPGINRVLRADGQVEELDHIGAVHMQPGDIFEVCTPGAAAERRPDTPPAGAWRGRGGPPGQARITTDGVPLNARRFAQPKCKETTNDKP